MIVLTVYDGEADEPCLVKQSAYSIPEWVDAAHMAARLDKQLNDEYGIAQVIDDEPVE